MAAAGRGGRLFRTYGARGGGRPQRQASRPAVQWFSPQDRKRFFSSSSSSCELSQSITSDDCDDPDDPDFGTPVNRRRRDRGGHVSRGGRTQTATPRRLGLRARPPLKCSTPSLPSRSPGRRSPDLSVRSLPRDGDELGTSASLFSAPASPSAPHSPDPAFAVPRGSHLPPASLDGAFLPCAQEAAANEGKFTSMARQGGSRFRSTLSSLVDPETPENSERGTGGKNARESCCDRQRMRRRLKGPSPVSTARKRATSQHSGQTVLSSGTSQVDYEEACTCRSLVAGTNSRPKRTRPSQKRKYQEAMETSVLHDHKSKKKGKESFPSQDLTRLQKACSWNKTRASFSFHKKKIITDVSDVWSNCTIASSLSESILSDDSSIQIMNRTNSAPSSWRSSSIYLLSPLKTLHVTDKKASDAEKVYRECKQNGPIPFSDCLSPEKLKHCEKIGEGVFGEVFQTITDQTPVALKIIAIEGPDLVNGAHQKTFEEILPEIIISKELSLLSDEVYNRTEGFIGLNSVHCVQGSYPPLLLKTWDHYNSTKGSANDRPDFFQEDQLFIILEFEFGGVDLEQMKTKLSSMATAKSILHQITASLAVAEASLHFEHRDLHWGNVLLKKTNLRELHYTLNGKTNTIPTQGLQVNIIDYTLSRLERDGIVIFCDISSEEDLFTGEGDYQFEIYRLMRKENRNCWGEYHPYNNVLWLHYLTDKILNHMSFKTKCHSAAMKQVKKKLQHFHKTVLNFSSATDLLCKHSLFK